MSLTQVSIAREKRNDGQLGEMYLGDACRILDGLIEKYEGQVKVIYLDPPFLTGEHFSMRVRVGEQDWKTARGSLELETFHDGRDLDNYLSMMRRVLTGAHRLLRKEGMLFLHIDFRTHPHLRLLMDEIFGADNFLNEIIWVYQTGGRSMKYFSRKHDVILFYRKSAAYEFDIRNVMQAPETPKSNHMRRHVDPDGRVYRSIRVNGHVYTYYDDDPVAPTDVWNDVSHLQQKDPERTGYDTQKPLALMERIIKCSSKPGELVMDLFAGSCTTLEAAAQLGRHFVGVDQCPLSAGIFRRRLEDYGTVLMAPSGEAKAVCEANVSAGIGFYHVNLEAFTPQESSIPDHIRGLDVVDGWAAGYLREDGFEVMAQCMRSKKQPKLAETLQVPVYSGQLALMVYDITGAGYCFKLPVPDAQME